MENSRSPQERICGPCSVCCYVYSIPEFDTRPYTRCPKLTETNFGACQSENGCREYDTRPGRCRAYQCLWTTWPFTKQSDPVKYRPDVIGVLFDTFLMHAIEVYHGRFNVPFVSETMSRVNEEYGFFVPMSKREITENFLTQNKGK